MNKRLFSMLLIIFLVSGTLFADISGTNIKSKYNRFVSILDHLMVVNDTTLMAEESDFAYFVFGFGLEYQLDEKSVINAGIGLIPSAVAGVFDPNSGSTLEMDGDVMCIDISLSYKYFLVPKYWVSAGMIYRALDDSYFTKRGEFDAGILAEGENGLDRMALKFSTGFDVNSSKSVYTGYAFSLSYDIPRNGDYTFSPYDVRVGIDFIINTNVGSMVRYVEKVYISIKDKADAVKIVKAEKETPPQAEKTSTEESE